MKIISVVAEVAPFSYVGGLARGTYFLGRALNTLGHDVRVFTPLHACVQQFLQKQPEILSQDAKINLKLPERLFGEPIASAAVLRAEATSKNLLTYFLDYPDYFSLRSRVYDYGDDHRRFHLFSVSLLEWLLYQQKTDGWFPDVLHCHDWHTGYCIDLLKNDKRYASLRNCKVLFTIHNFRYQNILKLRYLSDHEQDTGYEKLAVANEPALQKQNALLRGILFADLLNTVSPQHALEVQQVDFGYNLAPVLHSRKHVLSGVLNGLDYAEFNTQNSAEIAIPFSIKNWKTAKQLNKRIVQQLFGLPVDDTKVLLAYVGRMTSQKGLEMLVSGMRQLLRSYPQLQLVALGDGEDHYCDLLWNFAKSHADSVSVKLYHDAKLPKQIFAGADMVMIPSNYEPGGIVALEAMRYGAVPVARNTGGLHDSIIDFTQNQRHGNGFVFDEKTRHAFVVAVTRALQHHDAAESWKQVTENALCFRQTWETSAKQYIKLFYKLVSV